MPDHLVPQARCCEPSGRRTTHTCAQSPCTWSPLTTREVVIEMADGRMAGYEPALDKMSFAGGRVTNKETLSIIGADPYKLTHLSGTNMTERYT